MKYILLALTILNISTLQAHEPVDSSYIDVESFFEFQKASSCADVSSSELKAIENLTNRLSGDFRTPTPYSNNVEGLQAFLDDVGVNPKFTALEMITPHKRAIAEKCGFNDLLPERCRWVAGAAQGLLASKMRAVINDGDAFGSSSITVRNWWRPSCYNKKVQGATNSDHIQARGFDLDFETPQKRAIAQKFLCDMYKKKSFNLQVGIGCYTLHVGVGSPKRLSQFPKNGSRFWTYGSLQSCPLKRISGDDCWRVDSTGKKYIHTKERPTSGDL